MKKGCKTLRDSGGKGSATGGRVLCVSSSGGHWQQLNALRPAWEGREACYASTTPVDQVRLGIADFALIPDCNRNTAKKILRSIPAYVRVFRQVRPSTVVSTGALPGLIFIVMGKLAGARTVWVESIANSERLSLSGTVASYISDSFFVQAEHLADGKRRIYAGSVL